MQNRKSQGSKVKKMSEMRVPLSTSEIAKVKTRALRKGVWYRVLSKIDRVCIDLVIRVVDGVRSCLLQKVLSSVLGKLNEALESPVQLLMRQVGGKLALQVSLIGQTWGNRSAVHWAEDSGFVQYLTIAYMNAPS